jgi:hypothetical protein
MYKEGESMMTFVLVPAKEEGDVKADAWSLKGRHSVSGWSKSENGVIHVKLKITFLAMVWFPRFFDGHFDAERNALTGVWGFSANLEGSTDKMECRRIPPHYLTAYPNIKELSNNKTRSLWKFAIAAVRNDIRRDHWLWAYFTQRRDDRESLVPLLVRDRYFGPPLSDEERRKCYAIIPGLTSMDACFYGTKTNHIGAHTWVHE